MLVAHNVARRRVVAQQRAQAELLHDDAHVAHGAARALRLAQVEERHVALGGAVELAHLPQVEPRLKPLPNVRPQPVAHGQAAVVALVKRALGRREQVATQLANVLHHGAVVLAHLFPEQARAELPPQHQRGARVEAHAAAHVVGRGMVQRQARVVNAVLVANAKLQRKRRPSCRGR